MKLVKDKWAWADAAHAEGVQAYIEFGQALAQIDATQEEIAARYDISQQSVSNALAVGRDKRLTSNTSIPKSQHSLYLLTTLDDKGFAELAKPDTTQAKILEYKRRLAPPKEEPKPKVEPFDHEEFYRQEREELAKKSAPPAATRLVRIAPLRHWNSFLAAYEECKDQTITKDHIKLILGVERDELMKPALTFYTKTYHPDSGGDHNIMMFINQVRKLCN